MLTGTRLCFLALLLTGLVLALSPVSLLAQYEKTDMSLRLIPDAYKGKVRPGESRVWFLEIKNTGNRTLTNIRLSAEKQEDWAVVFSPETIDSLAPASLQTAQVNVRPPLTAYRGGDTITLIAEANETRGVISMYLTVESATTIWLWVGAGVAAAMVAGLVLVFLRSGRD